MRGIYLPVDLNNNVTGIELVFYGTKDQLIFATFMCEFADWLKSDFGIGLEHTYTMGVKGYNN